MSSLNRRILKQSVYGLLWCAIGGSFIAACSASADSGARRIPSEQAGGSTSGGSSGHSIGGDTSAGGSLFIPDDAGTNPTDAVADGSGITLDANPDVTTGACTNEGWAPGPYPRKCAPPTDNECDGASNINGAFPNGNYGNGFDDDCDGLVDEGCDCPPGVDPGETRECWLVPGSQVDSSGKPLGWCAEASRGTQSCALVREGNGEFTYRRWDGECRGAQPPYADDVCAPGDYNCDGLELNSERQDCSCDNVVVECPTDPIVTSPYPNPNNLLDINGFTWISGDDQINAATNWRWTVTGGDCDNILPHPSFAVYRGIVANNANRVGTKQNNLGPSGNQTGFVWNAGSGAQAGRISPAFALSGDYLVTGEFTLDGERHECTVRVHVRAPGIRAEACWSPMPNDLDLHFARLQNPAACGTDGHGWFNTCGSGDKSDDCYFGNCAEGFSSNPSSWGYTRSGDSACKGWGSRRPAAAGCDNPRLDQDNITCNPAQTDPNNKGAFGLPGDFCGAENINLDNPKNGERFAIGVHAYSLSANSVRPHVNIYCNGERRLSLGYDPKPGGQQFPVMKTGGASTGGDFWEVATVEAIVDGSGTLTDCVIDTASSTNPKADKDGSNDICVDTNPQNGGGSQWRFRPDGGYPASGDELCWH